MEGGRDRVGRIGHGAGREGQEQVTTTRSPAHREHDQQGQHGDPRRHVKGDDRQPEEEPAGQRRVQGGAVRPTGPADQHGVAREDEGHGGSDEQDAPVLPDDVRVAREEGGGQESRGADGRGAQHHEVQECHRRQGQHRLQQSQAGDLVVDVGLVAHQGSPPGLQHEEPRRVHEEGQPVGVQWRDVSLRHGAPHVAVDELVHVDVVGAHHVDDAQESRQHQHVEQRESPPLPPASGPGRLRVRPCLDRVHDTHDGTSSRRRARSASTFSAAPRARATACVRPPRSIRSAQ